MYQVEDDTIETLHLYVVREGDKRPSRLPVIVSLLTLSILLAIGVRTPYQQPVIRASIRVPAVPLGIKVFTASTPVIPTGIKTYPATVAHGWLTFSNGSIIGQSIPAGLVVIAVNGIPVVTDEAIYVPPATANGFGKVTVSARLGRDSVNLPAYSVSLVIGSSLFVRNLSPFTDGRPAYSVKFTIPADKQAALLRARSILLGKSSGLHYPCSENQLHDVMKMVLTWHCQFLTYHIPAYYHVTAVRLSGKNLVIDVWFIPRSTRIWVK